MCIHNYYGRLYISKQAWRDNIHKIGYRAFYFLFHFRYYEVSSELLTSVHRTEESLLKLKSYRKSLVPSSTSGGGGMTDDNKIRLQLALDIEEFTVQVLKVVGGDHEGM